MKEKDYSTQELEVRRTVRNERLWKSRKERADKWRKEGSKKNNRFR